MKVFLTLVCIFSFVFGLNSGEELRDLDLKLKGNVWAAKYANYSVYQNLLSELDAAKKELTNLPKNNIKSVDLRNKIAGLSEQTELLKEYAKSPFEGMFNLPAIENIGKITNPVALISGFSHVKQLAVQKEEYNIKLADLDKALEILERKKEILSRNLDLNSSAQSEFTKLERQISDFSIAKDVAMTTFGVYQKKLDEAIIKAKEDIKEQLKQLIWIIVAIILVILIGFLCKFTAKRYILDSQKFYTINKFINVLNYVIIVFILLFAYIENVSYLVTILGFASAGLAIAMKDMFMSFLGWSVIIAGGSFRVGDRIRVHYRNNDYVGDIIDISLLRMTIYEDITLTTYKDNRRSGRIIFVPNNYIFTELIANYTHGGMKTVWDGIDVLISFDSNHKKAMYIVKSIARKYAKNYTEIAKKQMEGLRNQYNIRNSDVEPRIYSMLESSGINISVWFETNSYATLGLRSTISVEIIDAINKEPDIKLAFPKQTLYLQQNKKREFHGEESLN